MSEEKFNAVILWNELSNDQLVSVVEQAAEEMRRRVSNGEWARKRRRGQGGAG